MPSIYDPVTRTAIHSGTPTRFEVFHEQAHLVQHHLKTWPWRMWRLTFFIPFLRHLGRYIVEKDATARTCAALIGAGLWTARCRQQANESLESYRTKLGHP